jgi:Fungal N-terminal domain of STAND proteins
MADPIGTTIGAVSLAIQVIGGIVQCCNNLKTQDEDVQSVKDLASSLLKILDGVKDRVQPLSEIKPSIQAQLDTCIQACDTNIQKAQGFCHKYSPSAPYRNLRRVQFLFVKDDLLNLRDSLTAFQSNLVLALQLLEM